MNQKRAATNNFPENWNEQRVQSLISHHETQNEDEALAEDGAVDVTHSDTLWGVVREGRIELLEQTKLPEGTKLLVTILSEPILSDNEGEFWLSASRSSLDLIWDNEEDDVYAELLNA